MPYGPVVKFFSEPLLSYFRLELLKIAERERVIFIRLDFTPSPPGHFKLRSFFKKSFLHTYHAAYFQPRVEWFLSLAESETDLLSTMHEKTRYSIKLAIRKGVVSQIIETDFAKYFEDFYSLMIATASRNGFRLHEKTYYQNIFQNLQLVPKTYLSIAKYQDRILVVDLIIVFGQTANYVFGCSSNHYRNLGASASAQWAAICQAKKIGCQNYNFGGVAAGKIYKGWDGLTKFKQRFGGCPVNHSDFYDLVAEPFWYHLYNLGKFVRKLRRLNFIRLTLG